MSLEERLYSGKPAPHFAVHRAELIKSTVEELRALIDKNPSHPKAVDIAKAINGLPDHVHVVNEQVDLKAIAENADIVVDKEDIGNGEQALVKRLQPRGITLEPKDAPSIGDPHDGFPGPYVPPSVITDEDVEEEDDR